jgi:hypothetical protein
LTPRGALTGLLAAAAILLLSVTLVEYNQITTLSSRAGVSTSTSAITNSSIATITLNFTKQVQVVSTRTFTVYNGSFLGVGNCTATSYFEADTIRVYIGNVTTTSGSVTVTYKTTSVEGPSPVAENSSSFGTTTTGLFTVGTTYTSTSDLGGRCAPSACWIVTVCTYSLETR